MLQPNEILNSEFLDFKLFPLAEPKILLQQCIGQNQKGILVVIFEDDRRTELLPFLGSILKAIHCDLNSDAMVLTITNKTVFSLTQFCSQAEIEARNIIFFGQHPKQVGLVVQTKKYHPLTIDQKTILFADDLAKIHDNLPLKKSLWICLKNIFSS